MLPFPMPFLNQPYYEGFYFVTAILFGMIYFNYLAKRENINLDKMYEAVFICIIAALATGRLFALLFWNTKDFLKDPLVFFRPWEGGLTVTGSVLGGLTAGFIYAKVTKLHFFYHIRIYIPPIVMGQIIGRFGCFLNGDASGKPTNLPWGLIYSNDGAAYSQFLGDQLPRLHPTQLYEIFGSLLLLLFLILTNNNEWITKRRIIWYAMGYSLIRFIVEFFRNDSGHWDWLPFLTTGQIITIGGFFIGLGVLIWSLWNDEKLDADEKNIARPIAKA